MIRVRLETRVPLEIPGQQETWEYPDSMGHQETQDQLETQVTQAQRVTQD